MLFRTFTYVPHIYSVVLFSYFMKNVKWKKQNRLEETENYVVTYRMEVRGFSDAELSVCVV